MGIIDVLAIAASISLGASVTAYIKWTAPALRRLEWPTENVGPKVALHFGMMLACIVHIKDAVILLYSVRDNEEVIESLAWELQKQIDSGAV